MKGILKYVKKRLANREFTIEDGFLFWREKILNSILFMLIIVGFFAFILGVYLSITTNLYIIILVDSVSYGLLLFLFFSNRINLNVRIIIIASTILILAITLLLFIGPKGAGLVYLMGFSILTAILLGLRAAILSLIIQFIVITGIGAGIVTGLFNGLLIMEYTLSGWIGVSINTLVISSISSIPLAILVNGLKNTNEKQIVLQKSLEQKIEEYLKAKQKAEESDNLKTRFLANMSHEIRTPLNSIMGFSEIICSNNALSEEKKTKFQLSIQQNTHRLISIIENILSAALLETNQMEFKKNYINAKQIFNSIKLEYQHAFNNTNTNNLIFKEPIIKHNILIFADLNRLKQAASLLIDNAIQFCPEGEITVGYETSPDYFKFYVRDNGIGIPNDKLDLIFNKFTQLEPDEGKNTGNGLGLTICKGIILAHKGQIKVYSEPENFAANKKGNTVFYFLIPASNL